MQHQLGDLHLNIRSFTSPFFSCLYQLKTFFFHAHPKLLRITVTYLNLQLSDIQNLATQCLQQVSPLHKAIYDLHQCRRIQEISCMSESLWPAIKALGHQRYKPVTSEWFDERFNNRCYRNPKSMRVCSSSSCLPHNKCIG